MSNTGLNCLVHIEYKLRNSAVFMFHGSLVFVQLASRYYTQWNIWFFLKFFGTFQLRCDLRPPIVDSHFFSKQMWQNMKCSTKDAPAIKTSQHYCVLSLNPNFVAVAYDSQFSGVTLQLFYWGTNWVPQVWVSLIFLYLFLPIANPPSGTLIKYIAKLIVVKDEHPIIEN